ncbi:MAG: carboxypeptidase-like regulatory domain-containing protein [Kofleriaceae bacterium]
MRNLRVVIATALLAACGGAQRGHIEGGVLGRVVVYRNGVAFYERSARVVDGRVTVHVPRDRVDDFLKSLTVVDRATKKPLVVTIPRREAVDGSYLTMTLATPGIERADVDLRYVTEAPAWKPSYRVLVGEDNKKVMLEGWAIVDNTTSEDWKGVMVGVGASSALAFRYDLWSVRQVDRDLLAGEEKFAIAPPTAVSPYAEAGAEELAYLDADELRKDAKAVAIAGKTSNESKYVVEGMNTTGTTYGTAGTSAITGTVVDKRTGEKLAGVTVTASSKGGEIQTSLTDEHGRYSISLPAGTYTLTFYYADLTVERSNVKVNGSKPTLVAQNLDTSRSRGEVVKITDSAPTIDPTSTTQSVSVNGGYVRNVPVPGRTFEGAVGSAAGSAGDSVRMRQQDFGGFDPRVPSDYHEEYTPPPPRNPVKEGDEKLAAIAAKVIKDKRDVLVEVRSPTASEKDALARAAAVKNKLVDDGVPANRVHVATKVGAGEPETVRVLAVSPQARQAQNPERRDLGPDTPVGESHFTSDKPMTVPAGSSAMVSMVQSETSGGIVYLYDPISDRGDDRFAFKAVRLDNPTSETLEAGPVTVYGDGRFIGEGITEAVLPHASVVVPFALDKQIVVSKNGNDEDRIAKILTVQRGIMTAEVQHRRQSRFTITSRSTNSARVYLRHRLATGWTLVDAPSTFTKVGDSQLFEVDLGPGETKYVTITEATPVQRTFDLGTDEALGMMKVFIAEPEASPQLRAQIEAVLATHRTGADLVDKIATLREQLAEYRSRSGELNAQLVTLKAVRTGGELMASLRAKQSDMSERIQKTTIALVEAQEHLMLARVKFQNQLADLRLTDATKPMASTR